jgi:hypothetical protein
MSKDKVLVPFSSVKRKMEIHTDRQSCDASEVHKRAKHTTKNTKENPNLNQRNLFLFQSPTILNTEMAVTGWVGRDTAVTDNTTIHSRFPQNKKQGIRVIRLNSNEIDGREEYNLSTSPSTSPCDERVIIYENVKNQPLLITVDECEETKVNATTHSNTDTNPNVDCKESCKICMENAIDCVILWCGHIATCLGCAKRLCRCPICRRKITRVTKTFKA